MVIEWVHCGVLHKTSQVFKLCSAFLYCEINKISKHAYLVQITGMMRGLIYPFNALIFV